jgi:hypothetical protein
VPVFSGPSDATGTTWLSQIASWFGGKCARQES